MNEINKTLYIPLYGKALVSRRGIILQDPKAEAIWAAEQFPLKGKSSSKWLALYMAMRARVFDDWARAQIDRSTVALHIGCGMDSRVLRTGNGAKCWYDIDFPEVIAQRRRYFREEEGYVMLAGDASKPGWVAGLADAPRAVMILEGISMYLRPEEIRDLLAAIGAKYPQVQILMDVYTTLGAKASRYRNPINDVGVTEVFGIDDPHSIAPAGIRFVRERVMAPDALVEELQGLERRFFRRFFAGALAKKLYRLYEYESE